MANGMEKYFSFYKRPNGIEYNEDGSKFCSSAQLINDTVHAGAMHLSAVWYLSPGKHDIDTHTHEVNEIVGFIGTDTENTEDLCGVMRFYIDGEWVEFDKSCFIVIPAGVEHCPYEVVSNTRPILHISSLPTANYGGNKLDGEGFDFPLK